MAKAILFDTRSIQKYIFSGNKLKTNIGASYIVEHLFSTCLLDILKELFPMNSDLESWKHEDAHVDFSQLQEDCCIAYIGGGNALVLFREDIADEVLQDIVTQFTKQVLIAYPGLKTGAAIGVLDVSSEEGYRSSDKKLHIQLKHYQNTIYPQVSIPYTGLTRMCDVCGETADYLDIYHKITSSPEIRYYSHEILSKAEMAQTANQALQQEFQDVIFEYRFPIELEKLGQKESENYIAIIHIDGNNMGSRFMKCKTLEERVRLSKEVKAKTKRAFTQLLAGIVAEYDTYKSYLQLEEKTLPIRPLILGGDDVTFVCAGRTALTYAKRCIEYMQKEGIESCGGIALLPTSYPFFRGYELAEQLCSAAKSKSREKNDSWLDFAILHGEQAPTLEQIRQQEYRGAQGNMHFGPYTVGNEQHVKSVDKLIQCVRAFASKSKTGLAENKIKELRWALQHDVHDCQQYIEQMKHTEKDLPDISGWDAYRKSLWNGKETPYIDAIEMMDFMPKENK